MKPSLNLQHKVQVMVTEEDWLALNRHLDNEILKGNIKPRTSFSAYIREILKKHLHEIGNS